MQKCQKRNAKKDAKFERSNHWGTMENSMGEKINTILSKVLFKTKLVYNLRKKLVYIKFILQMIYNFINVYQDGQIL